AGRVLLDHRDLDTAEELGEEVVERARKDGRDDLDGDEDQTDQDGAAQHGGGQELEVLRRQQVPDELLDAADDAEPVRDQPEERDRGNEDRHLAHVETERDLECRPQVDLLDRVAYAPGCPRARHRRRARSRGSGRWGSGRIRPGAPGSITGRRRRCRTAAGAGLLLVAHRIHRGASRTPRLHFLGAGAHAVESPSPSSASSTGATATTLSPSPSRATQPPSASRPFTEDSLAPMRMILPADEKTKISSLPFPQTPPTPPPRAAVIFIPRTP